MQLLFLGIAFEQQPSPLTDAQVVATAQVCLVAAQLGSGWVFVSSSK